MASTIEPLKKHTESTLYDSVRDIIERVDTEATHILIVTTRVEPDGCVHIMVDGNSSYMQRLGLLTAAIAQTQKEMGF